MGNECCETGMRPMEAPSKSFIYGYTFQKDSVESVQPILKTSNFVLMTPPNEYIDREQCQQPLVSPLVRSKMSGSPASSINGNRQTRGALQNGYFKFKRSGNIYYGEWKNNMPHGLGTLYIQKGNVYQGLFYEGVPFGSGRLIMNSGAVYEGEIKYGKANGQGVYTDGQFSYRGQFKDDLKDGEGQQRENDYYFKGFFEKGEKLKGIYKYESNIYEGDFQNDEFNGKGQLNNADGSKYKGSFKNGRFHGYGQFQWADGSLYRGHYIEGQREGDGQFFDIKNSSISKGIWQRGVLGGEGEYKDYRGKVTKCIWSNGKMTGIKTK